jgi:hypothetical protein
MQKIGLSEAGLRRKVRERVMDFLAPPVLEITRSGVPHPAEFYCRC